MKNTELLPCPFCGSVAHVQYDPMGLATNGSVHCVAMDCRADVWSADGKDAAIVMWNRRATLAAPAQAAVVPEGWRVREHRNGEGELLDCFVEAPPEGDMAYALEVLGDDYNGYGGVERKLEHCNLIVSLVNVAAPSPAQAQPVADTEVQGTVAVPFGNTDYAHRTGYQQGRAAGIEEAASIVVTRGGFGWGDIANAICALNKQ
jgi:hypothetical protein